MSINITTQILTVNENQFVIYIGRNARSNTSLINSRNADDVWFHLENESSPHITLEYNENITKNILRKVGFMIYTYKKSRDNVIYTELKNVKSTSTPGMVNTKNIKVLKYF